MCSWSGCMENATAFILPDPDVDSDIRGALLVGKAMLFAPEETDFGILWVT